MGLLNIFKKKNNEKNIQILEQKVDKKIFEIIINYLPNNWQEIQFFAGYYRDDSGYFKYWVKMENGQYIDCFKLIPEPKNGQKDILQEQFMKIHKVIRNIRSKLIQKNKWICMEISFTNQGKLTKKYDYADGVLKENLIQYVENYKNVLNQKYN